MVERSNKQRIGGRSGWRHRSGRHNVKPRRKRKNNKLARKRKRRRKKDTAKSTLKAMKNMPNEVCQELREGSKMRNVKEQRRH